MSYPTDLTDKEWSEIRPTIDIQSDIGRPREVNMREVINGLLYITKTGCQWNMIPNEFPPKSTVFYYFTKFKKNGTFIEINRIAQEKSRVSLGRDKTPTAAVIDSQTSSSNFICEDTGYDGNKKIVGRKRSIAVDVCGHLLCAVVHSAKLSDPAGSKLLLPILFSWFSQIQIIFADSGYSGNPLYCWVKDMFNWILKIIKRPRHQFKPVKFRWVVERTFSWLINYSRSYAL